ncbi:MAG: hypothetical protein RBT62_05180 [Spirochaetia bacterium]|jgi:hypothetical protein|nr:hypothetical protein [Spirochaetia bacterium]
MKKMMTIVLIFLFAAKAAFAQAPGYTVLPTARVGSADPQFALSILSDYFEKAERGDRTAGIVLTSLGAVFTAAGLASTTYAFAAPATNFSDPEGQMLMRGLSIGGLGAGVLLGGIGLGILSKPDDQYKREYYYLYAETDPVVQEAMAFGVMKELADEARRSRITGGIINISTPIAAAGGYAIAAAINNSWVDFGDRIVGSVGWTLPSLVSGIIMLISGKSEEERMLDSYRSMSASYSSIGSGRD